MLFFKTCVTYIHGTANIFDCQRRALQRHPHSFLLMFKIFIAVN
jgi:hypothetical protein